MRDSAPYTPGGREDPKGWGSAPRPFPKAARSGMIPAMIRIALALAMLPLPCLAQQVSDAALAECQTQHETYTEVVDCLPPMETAHRMLAAVESEAVFAPAAAHVLPWCRSNNDQTLAVWSCVRSAIFEADNLLKMVRDPSRIQDERFAKIASPGASERLWQLLHEARREFGPEVMQIVPDVNYFK